MPVPACACVPFVLGGTRVTGDWSHELGCCEATLSPLEEQCFLFHYSPSLVPKYTTFFVKGDQNVISQEHIFMF